MSLFPKTLIKWKEPSEFRKKILDARRKHRPKWVYPACGIFICAFICLRVWAGRFENPQVLSSDKIPALLGGMAFVIAIVYGAAISLPKLPSWIRITDKSIDRDNRLLRFKQIHSYCWLSGESHPVLQVQAKNGLGRVYGVPNLNTLEKIDQIFLRHDIPLEKTPSSVQAVLDKPAPKMSYVPFMCVLLFWLISFSVLAFGAKVLFDESRLIEQTRVEQKMEWEKFRKGIRALDLPADKKAALLKFSPKPIFPSKKR